MTAAAGKNPIEYISHHLGHWQVGSGLMAVNLDTLLFSVLTGAILLLLGWWVGRRVSRGRPGRLQNVLEMTVEFVNNQVREAFPVDDPLIGPMALTVFLWVMAMNAVDLIPVDFFPSLAGWVGAGLGKNPEHVHLHALATADLSVPLGMALSVFGLTISYNLRHRGPLGYLKRFLTHPFGKWMAPFNFFLGLVEEISRPLSLALRLWGNMFAGDLIFMLIALFGFAFWVAPGQVLLGTAWTFFETLEVVLQAFIFMLLSIVYLALAAQEEEH
ncbi:MAG TPA: F0F1 ATP synthase subunit A [Gammaproteobacteria bacterium]|nr:F0F1 ATP synthase subunit A [Gammaproteobacteria bacterium]